MVQEQKNERKKTILSGIQSSGDITVGHYAGAIRNWAALQHQYECFFMTADLHALTVRQEPVALRKRTLDVIAMYIACGIDPESSVLFVQSHVSAHAELAWILNCFTGVGECSRMTQFKEKSQQHNENVNVGLFAYPILMAADILLYQADLVPVGDDQKQHIELTRNLAERFNFHYSPTFTVPEPFIPPVGARIMSLQEPTKKMSKSDENQKNVIFLSDSDDVIAGKIRRAVTDSGTEISYSVEKRPGISNLITLYGVATGMSFAAIEEAFSGKTYSEFKSGTADAVINLIAPIRGRFTQLRSEPGELESLMKTGAEAAAARARRTLSKVYKKVGLTERPR
ncbi:tryptophan--tRNA ligase [Ignavibacteria bacterium]|nr:tryptophan--tRNA ligase [Bacteroidota bacterium]MCZ2131949.1 tryptophan--tRNA ligase [Bacteroidota bacterium]